MADEVGLRGMVSAQRLDQAIASGHGGELLGQLIPEPGPVDVLSNKVFPHLHADHTLDVALRRIAETGWKVLPVVSRDNLRQWKGTISLEDILAAYGVSAPQPQSEPHQPEAQQR